MKKIFIPLLWATINSSFAQNQVIKPNPAEKSVAMLVIVLGILIVVAIGYAVYKKSVSGWLRQFLMYAILIEVIASIYMFTTAGNYNGPARNYDNQDQTIDSSTITP